MNQIEQNSLHMSFSLKSGMRTACGGAEYFIEYILICCCTVGWRCCRCYIVEDVHAVDVHSK